MQVFKKLFSFFVFASTIFFCNSKCIGQKLEETYILAQKQQELHNFDDAKLLFERIIYFDSSHQFIESYNYLSQLNVSQGKLNDGIDCLKKYRNFYTFGTKEYTELTFKLVQLQLQTTENQEALSEILQLKSVSYSDSDTKRVNLYLAVCYFQTTDFDKSKSYFEKLIPVEKQQEFAKLFKKNNRLEKKYHPTKMQILSVLLPGAGQLYGGFYRESANSFLLVSSFIALFVVTNQVYGLLDAFMSVYPWASRYYNGGIKKTILLSKEKISQKRSMYYQKILLLANE
jgi:tetratricopeptide (TPR) repeat protein